MGVAAGGGPARRLRDHPVWTQRPVGEQTRPLHAAGRFPGQPPPVRRRRPSARGDAGPDDAGRPPPLRRRRPVLRRPRRSTRTSRGRRARRPTRRSWTCSERARRRCASGGPRARKPLFLILAPGESPNYPDGLDDNTHFSPLGASVMARLAAEGIREAGLGLAEHLLLSDPPACDAVVDADYAGRGRGVRRRRPPVRDRRRSPGGDPGRARRTVPGLRSRRPLPREAGRHGARRPPRRREP